MKKRIFQVLALVLALVMCAAVAVSVLADESDNSGAGTAGTPNTEDDTTKTLGKIWFDKNLIMPKTAVVPNVRFSFTLSANETAAGSVVGGYTVFKGIFDPKDADAAENPSDAKSAYYVDFDGLHPTTAGRTGNSITSDPEQKYATESFSIDFSKIDYKNPGMYRYMINEDEGDAAGIEYTGTATTYYIDVYVKYEGDDLVIDDVIVSKDDKLDEDEEEPGTGDSSEPTEPSESTGGNTSGGGSTGGDTSGEGSTGGDTSGEGSTGGDTSNGDTSGETSGGDTSGDTSSDDNKVNAGDGDDNTEPGEGETNPDDRIPNPNYPGNGGDESSGGTSGDNSTGGSTSGDESTGGSTSGDESTGGEGSKGDESGDTSNPGDDPNGPAIQNPGVNAGKSKADFNNVYTPLTLTLTKTVNGSQGIRSDYFEFEVTLSDVKPGVYYIVGAANNSGSDKYLVVQVGATEGKATVYLKHQDSISIYVPYNTAYTITEDEETAKAGEYTTATVSEATGWTDEAWKEASDNKTADGTVDDSDVTVAYVNHKAGTISTGILLAIAPFVVLMVVAVVGGVIVLKKKKKED